MFSKYQKTLKSVLLLLFGLTCCLAQIACQKNNHHMPQATEISPYPAFTPEKSIPENLLVRRDYRLSPGDQLEIIYHVRAQVDLSKPYALKVEDVIVIRFPFNPELNQRQAVHSDGHISLLLVGRVRAIGLTIDQLTKNLTALYGKYIKDPVVAISFEESNVKIKELKKAITTSPRGQSRLVPIKPDGKISLPFVVDIVAAGKTIEELHRDLNEAYYQAGIEEIEVTVNLHTLRPQQIFVYGEVRRPGRFMLEHDSTFLQAIGASGGVLPTAHRNRIILVRKKNLPVPEGAVLDFQSMLEAEKKVDGKQIPDFSMLSYDVALEDGDVIYVPRHDLAKANDWIDQVFARGLRGVVPYNVSFDWEIKRVNPYGGW